MLRSVPESLSFYKGAGTFPQWLNWPRKVAEYLTEGGGWAGGVF